MALSRANQRAEKLRNFEHTVNRVVNDMKKLDEKRELLIEDQEYVIEKLEKHA